MPNGSGASQDAKGGGDRQSAVKGMWLYKIHPTSWMYGLEGLITFTTHLHLD